MGYASPAVGGHALDLRAFESGAYPVAGVVVDYPSGHVVPVHHHTCGHLLYATEGVLLVEAGADKWLVPPTAAVWLCSHVEHQLLTPRGARACGLFVSPSHEKAVPDCNGVIHVSPLLRALIAEVVRIDVIEPPSRRSMLLGHLLLEELQAQQALPCHLPWPQEHGMARVCQAMLEEPSNHRGLDAWAAQLAMSPKTFQRRFQSATGLSFGRWRQQMRLLHSLSLLLSGVPLVQVALDSGYESHSAYTQAFRKHFGVTPSCFLQNNSI